MGSVTFPDTRIVLLRGADTRVLGLSSRVRNARVATRSGAGVVDGAREPYDEQAAAYFVPSDVMIDRSLFPLPPVSGPVRVQADGQHVFDLRTRAARRHAAWAILMRTSKPSDGHIARRFNRPISRVVSFALLYLGLSATQASILTLFAGLIGAAVAAHPGYLSFVTAGILFKVSSILDGVDGEIARATLTESDAGVRLDTLVDHLTYVAFFIGVTIGWAREGSASQVAIWTVVIAGGLVLSFLRGARFVSEHAPDASFAFIDRSVRRAARDSSGTTLRTAASLFILLRRDVFAVIFLFVSFTGLRVLVPALVAFGVLLANFTLSVYDRELAAAAALERLAN